MNKISDFIVISFLIILISCQSPDEKKARALIRKSIQAHGGQETWDGIESFSFVKESWLYNKAGEEEGHTLQQLIFRMKPYFEARIDWEKDSIDHRLIFDGLKMNYRMGENQILNEGFLQAKKKEVDAAFYVLNKPFSLLYEHLHIKYQGITFLAEGQEVETVQVIDGDPEDQNVDIWWYYFHPNTLVLLAYKVKTSDHYSLIYNREFDDRTGILFPAMRESFRVDSLGRHLYLSAFYEYREFFME